MRSLPRESLPRPPPVNEGKDASDRSERTPPAPTLGPEAAVAVQRTSGRVALQPTAAHGMIQNPRDPCP